MMFVKRRPLKLRVLYAHLCEGCLRYHKINNSMRQTQRIQLLNECDV